MNILFCDPVMVRNPGNFQVHVNEVLTNLTKLGHTVTPISSDASEDTGEPASNQRLSLWQWTKAILRSSPIYRRFQGEIDICWTLFAEIRFFCSTCIRVLKRSRRFDVIYRRHHLFNSEYYLGRLFRIPSIREVNGIVADEARIIRRGDRVSLRVLEWIERFNMTKADRIIVVTPKLKELLHDDYGIPADRIFVVENGANTELFKPMDRSEARRALELDQHGHYVCFVGLLVQWQGVEYLIKSLPSILEKCPDARALIIGDGPMKDELVELAEHFGVPDNVVFTGAVRYHEVPVCIAASDICVAPFVRERNERSGLSPLKMCEYAACAKPVVASRLPGLEFLEQHRLGVLAQPEDPQALAAAIITLLKDPELRKKMGQNGRKYVVEHRSWASVARRVAEVCQQAVQERKTGRRRTGKL